MQQSNHPSRIRSPGIDWASGNGGFSTIARPEDPNRAGDGASPIAIVAVGKAMFGFTDLSNLGGRVAARRRRTDCGAGFHQRSARHDLRPCRWLVGGLGRNALELEPPPAIAKSVARRNVPI